MPNHVTNRLTITGSKEQIDAFEAEFITARPHDTEANRWSFELLNPMPGILHRVAEARPAATVTIREIGQKPWDPGRPATDEEIAEITASGSRSWYDWAIANWGTKWDAYSKEYSRESDTCAVLRFDTAWSTPEPIYELLAGRDVVAPLTIDIVAFDEGWCHAYRARIEDGVLSGGGVEPDAALYEEVYGEPYEMDDEGDTASEEESK